MGYSILITNDDGIDSKGIKLLYSSVQDLGDVTVIAPAVQQSGIGVGMTLHHPLRLQKIQWEYPAVSVFSVNGTPVDCVKIGIDAVMSNRPNLVLSGINHGSNAGRNILYSGTIGAVIEAGMQEIHGIAFSSLDLNYTYEKEIKQIIRELVSEVLEKSKSTIDEILYNVNFPLNQGIPFSEWRFARQGKGLTFRYPFEFEKNTFLLESREKEYIEDEESDIYLLSKNIVTCTPFHVRDLTKK